MEQISYKMGQKDRECRRETQTTQEKRNNQTKVHAHKIRVAQDVVEQMVIVHINDRRQQ